MSAFGPVGSQPSNGMRMCVCVRACGQNELEVCSMLAYTHNYPFILYCVSAIHKHTRILKPASRQG